MQTRKHPLAGLAIAPENARQGQGNEAKTRELAESIVALKGLLQPLLAYEEGDQALVWEGGRRLRALQLLDGENRLPDAIREGVDVIITTKEAAALRSMATFVREDMHPADQFLRFNALFDQGQTPDQIAAACAVDSLTVSRLLRFRALAPEILDAFKAGKFGLDVAFAFTLSADHERQLAVLTAWAMTDPEGKREISPQWVRSRLSAEALRATDKWARFVGRKAYAEAGGTFLTDLFSSSEADEQFADGGLVKMLAEKKLAQLQEDLKAEGWSQVVVSQNAYGWSNGYVRVPHDTEEGKKKAKGWSAEAKAEGTAFIVIDYYDVKVERGWTRSKSNGGSGAAKPKTKAQEQPALYGFGHKGHHVMTQVATEAVRVGLVRKPDAAYDALLTHLAWTVLRQPRYGGVAETTASVLIPARRYGQPDVTVNGRDEFNEAVANWAAKLPTTRVAFNDAVAALSAEEKAGLLAVCFAATLDAAEAKTDGYAMKPDRWRHLGWMARHAGVDVAEAWTPDAAFLKGATRDALLAAAKELAPREVDRLKDARKGDLVAFVADRAQAKGWTPKLLQQLTKAADPKPAK